METSTAKLHDPSRKVWTNDLPTVDQGESKPAVWADTKGMLSSNMQARFIAVNQK